MENNKYQPNENIGLGDDVIALVHRWQNDKNMKESYQEEAMEYYVGVRENQVRNVKISHKNVKKSPVNKKLIVAAMTLGVVIGSTGAILGSGENIITKTVYPQISSSFYITPAGGTITDVYTRGYVDDMVVINKLIDIGYSDDVAAIVGEHCYNISPSKVSGSTFLGRINAKMSAVKNGKVVVDTMEDEKGVMKL